MSSRPTAAMLARHCYPDVPPEAVTLREVERLNVKPASVVWRVELERLGESRTLFLKHCHGKKAALQTRLYKSPPEKLRRFQPTIAAIWPDRLPWPTATYTGATWDWRRTVPFASSTGPGAPLHLYPSTSSTSSNEHCLVIPNTPPATETIGIGPSIRTSNDWPSTDGMSPANS